MMNQNMLNCQMSTYNSCELSVGSEMPEISRINCAFHVSEAITNFCTCQSCLLPLCPSCIKIHTLQHINLKKTHPSYEPITELMSQIYGEVTEFTNLYNEDYQKIVQIDARVSAFKIAIQQKISMVKKDLMNELERNFTKLAQETQTNINNMNYVKILNQYKEETKKTIIGLKNIERSFDKENKKIMRTIIKYKGGSFKQQLNDLHLKMNQFFNLANNNFVTFSVREDFKEVLHEYLNAIKKVQVNDVKVLPQIQDLSLKLKEVYEKAEEKSKKMDIKESIADLLKHSQSNTQHHSVGKFETQSVWENQSKINEKRRSISKGKGLSVIQINNGITSFPKKFHGKAININQPPQFNRTAFIRRPGY